MPTHAPKNERATIFVYGTLRRGGSNHFRMLNAQFIAQACVLGTLYQVTWYPALVSDPNGSPVTGEIYSVPCEQLPHLDAYEGPEYHRTETTATTADGEPMTVCIWEWRQSCEGLKAIPSGDWLDVR